jgi:hypothetical protein
MDTVGKLTTTAGWLMKMLSTKKEKDNKLPLSDGDFYNLSRTQQKQRENKMKVRNFIKFIAQPIANDY